jgi:hypothetical protein
MPQLFVHTTSGNKLVIIQPTGIVSIGWSQRCLQVADTEGTVDEDTAEMKHGATAQSPKKTKLRGLSPKANETDRATAACRRTYCQRDGSLRSYSRRSRPEPLLFLLSSSSVVLTRLSGPRSRPTTSQKIW